MIVSDRLTQYVANAINKALEERERGKPIVREMLSFELAVVALKAIDQHRDDVLSGKMGPDPFFQAKDR